MLSECFFNSIQPRESTLLNYLISFVVELLRPALRLLSQYPKMVSDALDFLFPIRQLFPPSENQMPSVSVL